MSSAESFTWDELSVKGVNNYSGKRSVATAFTIPLSQNAAQPQSERARGAANSAPRRSISRLFLTGHQMRQVKAARRGLLLWQQL